MQSDLRGKLVTLFDTKDHKHYFFHIPEKVQEKASFHTTNGFLLVRDMLTAGLGSHVTSNIAVPFLLTRPGMYNYIMHGMPRFTQIVYPKDSAYMALRMNINEGQHVVEAGTGSGAMSLILSRFIGPTGRLTTYEKREDFVTRARQNILHYDSLLQQRIRFICADVHTGIHERDVSAVCLDMKDCRPALPACLEALRPGGYVAVVAATTNQVTDLLQFLENRSVADVEVSEIMLRMYKTVAQRLRPLDTMVGHTAYMVFAK